MDERWYTSMSTGTYMKAEEMYGAALIKPTSQKLRESVSREFAMGIPSAAGKKRLAPFEAV